jgi:nucleoside-diphosphate kinase
MGQAFLGFDKVYKNIFTIDIMDNNQTLPQKQRTYLMIKPDGVQRNLVGEIFSRLERTSLKCVALKMMALDEDRLFKHYNKDDAWYSSKGQKVVDNMILRGQTPDKEAIEYGRDIIRALVSYMMSGPVVAMVFEGNEAINIVRQIVGQTEPATADLGTIRGDLTVDSYTLANLENRAVRNLVHASENQEDAQREISLWLETQDLFDYTHVNDLINYGPDFAGFKK